MNDYFEELTWGLGTDEPPTKEILYKYIDILNERGGGVDTLRLKEMAWWLIDLVSRIRGWIEELDDDYRFDELAEGYVSCVNRASVNGVIDSSHVMYLVHKEIMKIVDGNNFSLDQIVSIFAGVAFGYCNSVTDVKTSIDTFSRVLVQTQSYKDETEPLVVSHGDFMRRSLKYR